MTLDLFTRGFWILDDEGEPREVGLLTAAQWAAEPGNCVVQADCFKGALVSTVFLNSDHNYVRMVEGTLTKQPVLWETMILSGPYPFQARYTSQLDALIGHRRTLAVLTLYYDAPRKTKKAVRKLLHGSARIGPAEARRLQQSFRRL